MDTDLTNKVELAKGLLIPLKMYINPEIFKAEQEIIVKEKADKEREVTEEKKAPKARNLFDDISIRSKQDGVFRLPKELRDALERTKSKIKEEPPEDDEDTLG